MSEGTFPDIDTSLLSSSPNETNPSLNELVDSLGSDMDSAGRAEDEGEDDGVKAGETCDGNLEVDDHLIKRSKRTLGGASPPNSQHDHQATLDSSKSERTKAAGSDGDSPEEADGEEADDMEPLIIEEDGFLASDEELSGLHQDPSELSLYTTCYALLGEHMWTFQTFPRMVEAVFEKVFALSAKNPALALQVILHLSAYPQVQVSLWLSFEQFVRPQVSSSSNPRIRETALEIVRNLSRSVTNKPLIHDSMVGTLVSVLDEALTSPARDHRQEAAMRFAIGALNNVSTLESNAASLLRRPGFVQTVLRLCRSNASNTIRERAVWTLQSLAGADDAGRLIETSRLAATTTTEDLNVLQTLLDLLLPHSTSTCASASTASSSLMSESGNQTNKQACLRKKDHPEHKAWQERQNQMVEDSLGDDERQEEDMHEYVLEAIQNLARASKKGEQMISTSRGLANQLAFISRHSKSRKLKLLAWTCLDAMDVGEDRRKAMMVMETLCAVRCVPRVALQTRCFFRVFPSELVRKISEGLFGHPTLSNLKSSQGLSALHLVTNSAARS